MLIGDERAAPAHKHRGDAVVPEPAAEIDGVVGPHFERASAEVCVLEQHAGRLSVDLSGGAADNPAANPDGGTVDACTQCLDGASAAGGACDASVKACNASGKTADPNALQGSGEIILHDGQVRQYSLLVALGQLLQIQELQQLRLDAAAMPDRQARAPACGGSLQGIASSH